MSERRFRLGAEELIELGTGRAKVSLDRRPFLAGRTKSVRLSLGQAQAQKPVGTIDMLAEVAPYVANRLSDGLSVLSDVTGTPVANLSQSVDHVVGNLSGLVQRIPGLSDVLTQVLVLGDTLTKYGLSAPELLLRSLGNLLAGIGRVLKAQMGTVELQGKIDTAKQDIVDQGDPAQKDNLAAVLESAGVTGENPTPSINETTGQVMSASLE